MEHNEHKGKQSPGKAELGDENNSWAEVQYEKGNRATFIRHDPNTGVYVASRDEMLANAYLLIEAHNVANESGLWPREMQERIKKLETLMNDVRLVYARSQYSVEFSRAFTNECIDSINEALGITTPSTIN